jgi:hypothetical protein
MAAWLKPSGANEDGWDARPLLPQRVIWHRCQRLFGGEVVLELLEMAGHTKTGNYRGRDFLAPTVCKLGPTKASMIWDGDTPIAAHMATNSITSK